MTSPERSLLPNGLVRWGLALTFSVVLLVESTPASAGACDCDDGDAVCLQWCGSDLGPTGGGGGGGGTTGPAPGTFDDLQPYDDGSDYTPPTPDEKVDGMISWSSSHGPRVAGRGFYSEYMGQAEADVEDGLRELATSVTAGLPDFSSTGEEAASQVSVDTLDPSQPPPSAWNPELLHSWQLDDPRYADSDGWDFTLPDDRGAHGRLVCSPDSMTCAYDHGPSHSEAAPGTDPVELATGEFVEDVEDVRHGAFVMRRFYRSRGGRSTALGGFWSNHTERLFVFRRGSARKAVHVDARGRLRSFFISAVGVLHPNNLNEDVRGFVYPGTEHIVLATPRGVLLGFHGQGAQSFTSFPGGRAERYRAIDSYTLEIRTTMDRAYRMHFADGRITALTGPGGVLLVSYSYDARGNLASVTRHGGLDHASSTTQYVWAGASDDPSAHPSREAVEYACRTACGDDCADACAASCADAMDGPASTCATSAVAECGAVCNQAVSDACAPGNVYPACDGCTEVITDGQYAARTCPLTLEDPSISDELPACQEALPQYRCFELCAAVYDWSCSYYGDGDPYPEDPDVYERCIQRRFEAYDTCWSTCSAEDWQQSCQDAFADTDHRCSAAGARAMPDDCRYASMPAGLGLTYPAWPTEEPRVGEFLCSDFWSTCDTMYDCPAPSRTEGVKRCEPDGDGEFRQHSRVCNFGAVACPYPGSWAERCTDYCEADACTAPINAGMQECLGICSGTCGDSCYEECLDTHGVHGGEPEDRIVAVINGNGDQYLTNEYGADPTRFDYGKVVSQTFGDRVFHFTYTSGPDLTSGTCAGRAGWYEVTQTVEGHPELDLRSCFDDRSRLREHDAPSVADSLVLFRYDALQSANSALPSSSYEVSTRTETRYIRGGYGIPPAEVTYLSNRSRNNLVAVESVGHDNDHDLVLAQYRELEGGVLLPGDGTRSRIELRYERVYNQATAIVDPRGLEQGADPAEFTTTIERDARGLPVRVALPRADERDGRWHQITTERDFNAHGAVTELRFPGAAPVTYSYYLAPPPNNVGDPHGPAGAGLLAEVAQGTPEGTLRYRFGYDPAGRPNLVADPREGITRPIYDQLGLLQQIDGECGSRQEWDYDQAMRPIAARHDWTTCSAEAFHYSLGEFAETTIDFNVRNEVTRMCRDVDGTVRCTAFAYDPFGEISSVERLPALDESHVTRYVSDALGRLTRVEVPRLAPYDTVLAATSYADGERMVTVTNPHGGAHTIHRDSLGRVVRVERPDGTELRRIPDAADRTTRFEIWGPLDQSTGEQRLLAARETDYGQDGLPVAVRDFRIDADGTELGVVEQHLHYNDRGQIAEVASPALATPLVVNYYDSAGRLEAVDHLDGTTSLLTYNAGGEVSSRTVSSLETPSWSLTESYTYNDLGQLEKRTITDDSGDVVTWESQMLDSTGQLMGQSWPADELGGPVAHLHRDFNAAGETRRLVLPGPDAPERSFGYDGLGRSAWFYDESTKPGDVPTVSWDYASVPDATKVVYRDGSSVVLHRGDGGAVRRVDDVGGVVRTLGRDAMGRVQQVDLTSASATMQHVFGFDGLGRISHASVTGTGLPAVTTDRRFDSLGNLVRDEVTVGATTNGTWSSTDDLGRPSAMGVIGAGTWTQIHYDGRGRPSYMLDEAGASIAGWTWSGSRVTGRSMGGVTESYAYDGGGRLSRITSSHGADVLFDQQCRTTAAGNPDWCWDHVEQQGAYYEYDLRSRLEQTGPLDALPTGSVNGASLAVTEQFDLDLVGSSLSDPARAYDLMNRMASIDGNATSHTAANELSQLLDQQLEWDLAGRLRSVTDAQDSHSFVYDAFGRLVERDDLQVVNFGGLRVQDEGVLQRGSDPATDVTGTRRYIHAGGEAPAVTRYAYDDPTLAAGLPNELTTIADRLGSVAVNVQNDGSVWDRRDYTAYGLSTSPSQQECEGLSPFGFTGRSECAGLTNMRARWYSPLAGRFLSEDPVVPRTLEPNTYLYAAANPVRFTDPLGLAPQDPQQAVARVGGFTPTLGALADPLWLAEKSGDRLLRHGLGTVIEFAERTRSERLQAGSLPAFFPPLGASPDHPYYGHARRALGQLDQARADRSVAARLRTSPRAFARSLGTRLVWEQVWSASPTTKQIYYSYRVGEDAVDLMRLLRNPASAAARANLALEGVNAGVDLAVYCGIGGSEGCDELNRKNLTGSNGLIRQALSIPVNAILNPSDVSAVLGTRDERGLLLVGGLIADIAWDIGHGTSYWQDTAWRLGGEVHGTVEQFVDAWLPPGPAPTVAPLGRYLPSPWYHWDPAYPAFSDCRTSAGACALP